MASSAHAMSLGGYIAMTGAGARRRVQAVSLLVVAIILTFPINLELVGSAVRFVDLVIFVAAVVWSTRVGIHRSATVTLTVAFFVVQLISMLWGVTQIGVVSAVNTLFLAKYALPFITFAVLTSVVLPSQRVSTLLTANLVVLALLGLYAYVYVYLFISGALPSELRVGARASFPLTTSSEGQVIGDPHLFGAYLAHGIVLLTCLHAYRIVRLNTLVFIGLIVVLIGGMVLTGSRNGVASLTATAFFGLGLHLALRRSTLRVVPSTALAAGLFLGAAAIALAFAWENLNVDLAFTQIAERAVTVGADDHSVLSRVVKFKIALDQVLFDGPVLIGIGYTSTPIVWYDSSIASLLVSGGVIGTVLFVMILGAYVVDTRAMAHTNGRLVEFNVILIVLFNYVVANLVTEFFLVTRSVVPVVVALALLGSLVRTPRVVRAEGTAEGRT